MTIDWVRDTSSHLTVFQREPKEFSVSLHQPLDRITWQVTTHLKLMTPISILVQMLVPISCPNRCREHQSNDKCDHYPKHITPPHLLKNNSLINRYNPLNRITLTKGFCNSRWTFVNQIHLPTKPQA